jgi:hypothetical protein
MWICSLSVRRTAIDGSILKAHDADHIHQSSQYLFVGDEHEYLISASGLALSLNACGVSVPKARSGRPLPASSSWRNCSGVIVSPSQAFSNAVRRPA